MAEREGALIVLASQKTKLRICTQEFYLRKKKNLSAQRGFGKNDKFMFDRIIPRYSIMGETCINSPLKIAGEASATILRQHESHEYLKKTVLHSFSDESLLLKEKVILKLFKIIIFMQKHEKPLL